MAPRKSLAKSPVAADDGDTSATLTSPRVTRSRARRSPSNPSSPKKAGSKSPLRKTSPSPRRGPKGTAVSQASSLMATPVSPKRSKSPVKSASLAKSPVAVKSLSSASARQTKPTPSNVDHYYYLAYVSVFFSAYLYLFYIMEKKFCIDNVLKVWQSGKALSMLCEEAFYRSILTTFKGYLEILLQPFLLVSTLNAFFETAHHFFGCNKSFKQRVSSVGETYFPFITNILLYVMFISCPVKATSSHPLVFTLLSTMIIEKFIVFLHRLLTISLDTVPKSVHYLRYNSFFVFFPLYSISVLILLYEYALNHPSMSIIQRTMVLLFSVYSIRVHMRHQIEYMKEREAANY